MEAREAAQAAPGEQAGGEGESEGEGGDGSFTENEIVVTAGRLPGEVLAPQPPILELDEQDIASYGSGSIAELIESLSTVTGSGRGRGGGQPIFLINGARVSSFREMSSYPPEALLKVEVLSEEVAQQFGYSPDQRVINFILKDNFQSREIELEYEQPDRGGYSQKEAEATYLLIDGASRFNLNAEINDTSLLTEAERGVIQAEGTVVGPSGLDPADYRSLISDSVGYELTGNWTTKLADNGTSLSLNGAFKRDDNRSLQGLDADLTRPLELRRRTDTFSLGSTLNLPLGDWQLTGTLDANHVKSRSEIDRFAEAGFDEALTKTDSVRALVTAIGRPLYLPAGEVTVTLDSGYDWNRIASEDTRNPGVETRLTRGDLSAGVNVGVPLISSDMDRLGELVGDLSLNLNAGVDYLSDFGTLTDWTVGLNWGPTEKLNFNASYIARDAAPSLAQLGNPEIATPNVQIFDLSRGETVLATVVTGGNPNLPAQKQRDWKVGASWELPLFQNTRVTVDYFKNHSDDVAAAFPLLTPAIEAAFPGRVTRDMSGRLVSVDQRPVTFAETDSERLQIGLNLSGAVGKPRPDAENGNGNGAGGGGGFFAGARQAQGAGEGGGQRGGQGGSGDNREAFEAVRARGSARRTWPTRCRPPRISPRCPNSCSTTSRTRTARSTRSVGPSSRAGCAARRARSRAVPAARAAGSTRSASPRCASSSAARAATTRCRAPKRSPRCPNSCSPVSSAMTERSIPTAGRRSASASATPTRRAARREARAARPDRAADSCSAARPAAVAAAAKAVPAAVGAAAASGAADRAAEAATAQGRWFVGLNHTIELSNTVLIADGGPELDLLDGDALASALPRHSTQMRAGVFYRGFGLFVNGRYTGSSRIEGSELPGSTDLYFNDIATFGARFFVDLNQRESLVEAVPLLKNTRVTFSIDNVFDARQRVVDSNGDVPLRYQPFLIDPVGRFVGIELRKMF